MVVRMVDVDAYIERPDEQILGDAPATLDVQEVVGIGHQGANHFRGRRGRKDSEGADVGSRSSSPDLVRVMEEQVGHSGPESLQGYEGGAGRGDQERGCDSD